MIGKRLLATLCIVAVLPHAALADVVATTGGERRKGVVADREAFARNPHDTTVVSLLVTDEATGQSQLVRIPAAEIEYVVLEDADQQRVFDLKALASTPTPAALAESASPEAQPAPAPASPPQGRGASRNPNRLGPIPPQEDTTKRGSIVLTLLGVGAVAFGLLVKFGEPNTDLFGSDEKTYDAGNYFLIVTGGAMIVGGLLMLGAHDSGQPQQEQSDRAPQARLGVCLAF